MIRRILSFMAGYKVWVSDTVPEMQQIFTGVQAGAGMNGMDQ